MTKILILPAEIASRELDARLLHGVLALRRGWRVIVGSKALINRGIWRLPSSLYLCQTLTHKRLKMLRLLCRLGHISYGWDEEGIIYLDRDVYLMRRVSTDTLGQLAGLIAWGRESAEDLNYRAKTVNLSAQPLGNPRFDLLRPELRSLYTKEVDAIRNTHGEFVLINTNFSSFNPVISLHDLPNRTLSHKNEPKGDERERFARVLEHRRRIFNLFLADLPKFTGQNPDLKFIVRPHPGEDLAIWNETFRGQENVRVIREGASIPWLIAAKALVHNSCTTAVEATVIGHTPIVYCPELSLENESGLPNPISHRALTIDELSAAVRLASKNQLPMGSEQSAVLERYVSSITGPLATETILDYCEEIYGSHSKLKVPTFAAAALARLFAAGRHAFKSMRREHLTDRYLAKVFPAVSSACVAARATEIAMALGFTSQVAAREISANIFELTVDQPAS
jgi:surface carbohydrate biosynthesis protein